MSFNRDLSLNIVSFCTDIQKEFAPLDPPKAIIEDKIESLANNIPDTQLSNDYNTYKAKLQQLKSFEKSFSIFKKIRLFFPFLRSKVETDFIKAAKKIKAGYRLSLEARINEKCNKLLGEISKRANSKTKFDANEYSQLPNALKLMANRIYETKSFFERIFKSKLTSENTVDQTLNELHKSASKVDSGRVQEQRQHTQIREKVQTPKMKRQLNAIKVIGRNELPNGWDNGIDIRDSAQEVLRDITSFQQESGKSQSKLTNAVNILKDFVSIRAQSIENPQRTASLMQEQIKQLKIGETCILPGGYYNRDENDGHAVVYSIQRLSENKYSFTVINTGEGANVGLFSNKAHDFLWSDLTLEQLNGSIVGLASFLIGNGSSMAEVQEHLRQAFGKPTNSKYKHELQVNGTCSYDSIICWLESYLDDPNLMIEFQYHIAQNALNALESNQRGLAVRQKHKSEDKNDITIKHLDSIIKTGKDEQEKRVKRLPHLTEKPVETRKRAAAEFTISNDAVTNLNEEIRLLTAIKERGISQLHVYNRFLAAKKESTTDIESILHHNDENTRAKGFDKFKSGIDNRIKELKKQIKKLEK